MGRGVALVTGASAGFGRATVIELATRGWQVYGGFRGSRGGFEARAAALGEACREHGATATSIQLDVTDDASVAEAVARIHEETGRLDALVNVAGIGVHGPWPTISVADFERQIDTNLVGTYRMCLAVEPILRAQGGGWIVNVGSDAGLRATLWEAAYSASKYGVEGMSLGMRFESQQFGIRVSVVEPGWYAGTEYEDAMISTVDWAEPEGPYADLVRTMGENQPKVESGKPGLEAVARRIAELLEMDDPPFQNPVGASPLRTEDVPLPEFERKVFAFYDLERFRGPWARRAE